MKITKIILIIITLIVAIPVSVFIYFVYISPSTPGSLTNTIYTYQCDDTHRQINKQGDCETAFSRSIFGDVYISFNTAAPGNATIKVAERVNKEDVEIILEGRVMRIDDQLYLNKNNHGHTWVVETGTHVDINRLIIDPYKLENVTSTGPSSLRNEYQRDSLNVYYNMEKKVIGADPDTFTVVHFYPDHRSDFREAVVGYDENSIFIKGERITDSAGFKKINEETFSTNKGIYTTKGDQVGRTF